MQADGSRRRQHARRIAWTDSPLGSFARALPSRMLLSEGPVRFLLVSGERTTEPGAWSAPSGSRSTASAGGSSSAAVALARQRDGPELQERSGTRLDRRARSTRYWQGQVGMASRFMIDPQQHADTCSRSPGASAPLYRPTALRRSSHSSQVISTSRAFDPCAGRRPPAPPAGPSGARRARTRPSACAAASRSSRAGSGSRARRPASADRRRRRSGPPPPPRRSCGGRPSPSTLCS